MAVSEQQQVDGREMLAGNGWQRERVDGGVWIAVCGWRHMDCRMRLARMAASGWWHAE